VNKKPLKCFRYFPYCTYQGYFLQMMPVRIGVDIIEISRIREALICRGDRFVRRVCTPSERGLQMVNPEYIASRFAGKEAVMKALGGEGVWLSWQDIEILTELSGRPVVNLYGQALTRAHELGIQHLEISLSHSRENAIAFVVGTFEL
jgi:holo-[acyl-carrier protein] synthase